MVKRYLLKSQRFSFLGGRQRSGDLRIFGLLQSIRDVLSCAKALNHFRFQAEIRVNANQGTCMLFRKELNQKKRI